MPNKLRPEDVEEDIGVDQEDVELVLDYLIRNGWMLGRYVEVSE